MSDFKSSVIPKQVTVSFYDLYKKVIITPSDNNIYTSRSDNGTIVINLEDATDRAYLDILMKMDSFNLQEIIYKVVDKEYHDDGKKIFITLIEKKDS